MLKKNRIRRITATEVLAILREKPWDRIGWDDSSALLPIGDVVYLVTNGADGTSTDLVRIEP